MNWLGIQGNGVICFSLENISSLSLLYIYSFCPLFVVQLASVEKLAK